MNFNNICAIDMFAQNTIKHYNSHLLKSEPQEIPLQEIIEFDHGIRLVFANLSCDNSILGITVFEDCAIPVFNVSLNKYQCLFVFAGTIVIDCSLLTPTNTTIFNFTLAHEFAHWLIHYNYFLNSNDVANKSNAQSNFDGVEIEADVLALSLLLPRGRVKVAYDRLIHKFKYDVILRILADTFNVSVMDITKRLDNMNIVRFNLGGFNY